MASFEIDLDKVSVAESDPTSRPAAIARAPPNGGSHAPGIPPLARSISASAVATNATTTTSFPAFAAPAHAHGAAAPAAHAASPVGAPAASVSFSIPANGAGSAAAAHPVKVAGANAGESHVHEDGEGGSHEWGVASIDAPIFMMSATTVEQFLQSSFNHQAPKLSKGLTQAEADVRLLRDGPNQLTPPPEESEILKYLSKFLDPFMILLWGAGILSFIAYGVDTSGISNLWVAIVLFAATFISSTFTYIQEGRASAVMKSFKNLLPRHAHVIRDGRLQEILARDLVVGDVVVVGTGDQVPADIRVIYQQEMKVEKSSLTGESLPVPVGLKAKPDDKIEEAGNIIFNTTKCTEGEAVGIVFATGDRSLIGRIASLASGTTNELTPIQKEVKRFVILLSIFAFILGIIFLIIGLTRGRSWIDALINSFIVVLIACVPEGLPLTVVSCLTITAKRMAKRNVYVKQLRSVETLGSTTVIASDKTGTLTQNKMTVRHLWFDFFPINAETVVNDYSCLSPHYSFNSVEEGRRRHFGLVHSPTLNALEIVAACCNRARFEDERLLNDAEVDVREKYQQVHGFRALKTSRWKTPVKATGTRRFKSIAEDETRGVIGDGSDMALFNFMRQRQQIEVLRYHNRVIFELPFNSRNKFALCIVAPHEKFYARVTIATDSHSMTGLDEDEDDEDDRPPVKPQHRVRCISLGQKEIQEHHPDESQPERPYNRRIVILKGAPEVVVTRCTHYMMRGLKHPIDDDFREEFQAVYEKFGSHGERVLGFAWKELNPEQYPPEMDGQYNWEKQNVPCDGLVFLGLMSLFDPPKPTVPKAIRDIRGAGLKVFMVTGDHEITAEAIARQVGIITKNTKRQLAMERNVDVSEVEDECEAVVVHGKSLPGLQEKDWDALLSKDEIVFARTTPEQKLQIVTHLQRLKHIVGVTGDGVNDSPALKKGDIGLAMGIVGSDVARDVADVILLDDEFSSVVHGIRYGRAIFDNLSKTIAYTVTHLVPEAVPILLSIAFDFPPALGSLAILAIDCGSELAPAVSFAYEPPEGNVMSRPPRNALKDRLFTPKMGIYCMLIAGAIETLVCYLAWLLVFQHYHISSNELVFSSSYFKSDSKNLRQAGPLGCELQDPPPAGCQFLTGSKQVDLVSEAAGAYWWTLVMAQVFHIWMCKTRYTPLLEHGVFNNMVMWYGVSVEILLILIFIFIPKLNDVLVGLPFPSAIWPVFLISWVALLIVNEGRKHIGRRYPDGFVARHINW